MFRFKKSKNLTMIIRFLTYIILSVYSKINLIREKSKPIYKIKVHYRALRKKINNLYESKHN